ncbi:MAG: glycosyltransferase, partial [Actinobacteria bacterium]
MSGVTVVVPTYNEAENISVLVERLLALEPQVDVLVVDDHSPDGTGSIAQGMAEREPRLTVIDRSGPRGYARASIEGLRAAIARGGEFVCTMDADLSHDPDVLPGLVERARAGADLVIGSRYVDGGELVVDWGPVRRAV